MPPCTFYGRIPVYVGDLAQAEAVRVRTGVGETVHDDRGHSSLKYLSNAVVQFVVGDVAPVVGFAVVNRRHVARCCENGILLMFK